MINRRISPKSQFHKDGLKILKRSDRITTYLFIVIFLLLVIIFGILAYFLIFTSEHYNLHLMTNEFIKSKNHILAREEIINLFSNQFPNTNMIISDSKYMLTHSELITAFLNYDKTNQMAYLKDINDCDNFAFILFGNFLKEQYQVRKRLEASYLFGVIYGYNTTHGHTYNFYVDQDSQINCIEPQDDKIISCYAFNYVTEQIII